MATSGNLLIVLLLLSFSFNVFGVERECNCSAPVERGNFPQGFVFGVGTSSYQIEGAYNEDGKGISIWDNFTHTYPERIANRSNGDVATDSYHRYKEDVCLVKQLGLDAYKFQISWSRILPDGRTVNPKAVNFYNNLINELIAQGIEPFAILFHFELPQALEDEYMGFLNLSIVDDFRHFCEVCFQNFGDRIKHWVTLNEPYTFAKFGYSMGLNAPGRCSKYINNKCTAGDSAREPYVVAHHFLLAHLAAVESYRNNYQPNQKGIIGITLCTEWYIPYTDTDKDQAAQRRAQDAILGWFMDPLAFGDYPKTMRDNVGSRLPNFTTEQSQRLKGSFDFIGLNYYSSNYVLDDPTPIENASRETDAHVQFKYSRDGVSLCNPGSYSWLCNHPPGLRDALIYLHRNYSVPLIYITENGDNEKNDPSLTMFKALNDTVRKDYINDHLCCVQEAIYKHNVNVNGHFIWSLLDSFEWADGYTVRFGLYFVEYAKDMLTRYPKNSALWLKSILQKRGHTTQLELADQ